MGLITGLSLMGLLVAAIGVASVVLQGPRLGQLITGLLPAQRGKMIIGGVRWKLRALADLVTDTPSPMEVDGLKIIDPEGTLVLDVPHLSADIKLRTLIAGSFSIHNLKVGPKSMWRFASMKGKQRTPQGLPDTTVGFTAALQPKTPEPPKAKAAAASTFFHIVNADLKGLTAVFDFNAWGLELRDINGAAHLEVGVNPKLPVGFDCRGLDARGGGYLRILADNVLPFDDVQVSQVATLAEYSDDIFLDLKAGRTGRSTLVGKGFFTGIYGDTSVPGIDMHAEFSEAADALGAVAKGHGLTALSLTGAGAHVTADLKRTFEKLDVKAGFKGLDVAFAPYQALGLGFDLHFDNGGGRVDVDHFGFRSPGGGTFGLRAGLDINTLEATADLKLADFATAGYLPASARAMAAGRVTGKLHAEGGITRQAGAVRGLDMTLVRSRAGKLPRVISLRGEASASPTLVKTSGITVSVSGAHATVHGQLALARQEVEAGVEVAASDLKHLLGNMGLPPLLRALQLRAALSGKLANPSARGDLQAEGVGQDDMVLPKVDLRFALEGGLARLLSLHAPAWGGALDASGQAELWRGSTAHMLKSPLIEARVDGRDIDLGQLLHDASVAGKLSFHAEAHGPADKLTARLQVPAGTQLVLLGEAFDLGPVEAQLLPKEIVVDVARLTRRAGGSVEIKGRMALDERKANALGFDVTVIDVPLGGIPGLESAPIVGIISAALHVGGNPDKPRLDGEIRLTAVSARGIALGDGLITLSTTPAGAVKVAGDLFHRFKIDALASFGPAGPSVSASLAFEHLVLEELLPELVALGDGRGVASGKVSVEMVPGKPMAIDARLTEVAVSLARETEGPAGELVVHRIEAHNAGDIHATLIGAAATLDEMRLVTTGGDVRLGARVDLARMAVDAEVEGHVDLELLQPFVRGRLERLSGDLTANLTAGGHLPRPSVRGTLAVGNTVRIRPVGWDADLTVPSGRVDITTEAASLQNLVVAFAGAKLTLDGDVAFDKSFAPSGFDVTASGDVSARLLELVAPEVISDAKGRAHLAASIRGTPREPLLKVQIDLGRIDFRLRDLGRDVRIDSGLVTADNAGVTLSDVKVVLDDSGSLTIGAAGVRPGRIELDSLIPFKPGDIDLPLRGERLTYRVEDKIDIDDLTFDLALTGDLSLLAEAPEDALALDGDVRLVSGRYMQDFAVKDLAIRPRINESGVRPFYEGIPALEDLDLDLRVRTVGDGLIVHNNLAPEIFIAVDVHVGGDVAQPRIAGNVRPTDGRFHIPGLRGDFDLVPNVSFISFVDTKSLADGETPEVNLEATSLVADSAGNDHNVHLRINGPIGQMQLDMSSDDGLDRNQVAMLLLSGRTQEDATRTGTANPTVGANINTATDVAGQITRDAVDNLMRPYINDTFERMTGMELRLAIGADGIEGRLQRRVSRYLQFSGGALLGFQGQSKYRTEGTVWLQDYVNLTGGAERLTLVQTQGISETLPWNYNLGLAWEWAFRR